MEARYNRRPKLTSSALEQTLPYRGKGLPCAFPMAVDHFFSAFGCCFRCDEDLTDLVTAAAPSPNAHRIVRGDTPLPGPTAAGVCQLGPFAWARPGYGRLEIPGGPTFEVRDGRMITVFSPERPYARATRLFLLYHALPLLLQQRGALVFRASAVVVDGKAVLFMGPTAIGKSTIAAAICQRGAAPLSDGVSVIRGSTAWPGYPHRVLYPDAMEALGLHSTASESLAPGLAGKLVPQPDEMPRLAIPLGMVVQLQNGHVPRVSVEIPLQVRRLAMLDGAICHSSYLHRTGRGSEKMAALVKVVASTSFRQITFSRGLQQLDAVVDCIHSEIDHGR